MKIPEGFRFCNQCLIKELKPLSDFDDGKKSCRSCLERRRRKYDCPCGGKYTQGGISHHKNTKRHIEWEQEKELVFGFGL